jgi:hypothetical protein
MKASAFFGHAIPATALTLLCASAISQPLPRTSLNKSSPSNHSITFGATQPADTTDTCAPDGLCLAVTLALADAANPALCGTQTNLAVNIGDQVNICYTVTNHSSTTLNYHSLSDDHAGTLLTNRNAVLAPHASYQYNRTITASTSPTNSTGTFTSSWRATDALPGYGPNDTAAFNFIDIRSNGTALNLSDDGAAAVTMPFPFTLYTTTSDKICIGNNGGIYLDMASCSAFPYNNTALPSSGLNKPAILPYWDDLMAGGVVYYGTLGTAPNRRFVVQWTDKTNYGDGGDPTGQSGATFQVLLNEAGSTIDFEYQKTSFGGAAAGYDNGASATVGLQSNASFANQYSYNTPSLRDGLAIAWTPLPIASYTATATATLDVGSPSMITSPNASVGFAPSVPAGSNSSSPLLIDNIGNRNLAWSLTPPAPNAHFPETSRTVVPSHGPWEALSGISPYSMRQPYKSKPAVPLGTDAVPVYATKVRAGASDYVTFDAKNPAIFNTILPSSVSLFGITFVNNDFSKQYGVDYNQGDLYTISTLDGSTTLIGNTGLVSCCLVVPGGMRWDPSTGVTYLVIDNFGTQTSKLYTIDLTTAATTLVGTLPGGMIRDIAIDGTGLMYGIDSVNDALVAIDKTTADVQVIGSIGFDAIFGQGLDFDAETGILYLSSANNTGSTMYTLDPATGASTLIGTMGGEVDSMAIAKSGAVCATAADTPWLSYDLTSGTVAPDPDLVNPAIVNVRFDAANLAPGTYATNVCVFSNDLSHARVAIPVSLTVTVNDVIFRNGFDG